MKLNDDSQTPPETHVIVNGNNTVINVIHNPENMDPRREAFIRDINTGATIGAEIAMKSANPGIVISGILMACMGLKAYGLEPAGPDGLPANLAEILQQCRACVGEFRCEIKPVHPGKQTEVSDS